MRKYLVIGPINYGYNRKKNMIDNRLKTIAEMVTRKGMLLDVGTDHGYLPIYLIKHDILKNAIASDVSKGSLAKAIEEVKKEKLTDKIQTRLGSGLKVIKAEDEIDTIVLAGMGGILISQLIDERLEYIRKNDVELIVQPVQSPESVRKYFCKNGFSVKQEKLAKAEGRIYHIIKARPDAQSEQVCNELADEIHYELGSLIMQDKGLDNQVLLEELITYKLKEQHKIKANLESIDPLHEKYQKRYEEVTRKIESLSIILADITLN